MNGLSPGLANRRAITPQNAFLTQSLLKQVILTGTGRRALALNRSDLAGKTGTTNNFRDAWFSGFNPEVNTTVFVGFDDPSHLGKRESGASAALPIWISYMGVALKGVPDRVPELPEGLAQARIDPETGLLAKLDNPDAIMELFQAGRLPSMEERQAGENPDATEEEDPYDNY